MILSPNKMIGSLVYRTREALNRDDKFLSDLRQYYYWPNFIIGERMTLWHYPGTSQEIAEALRLIGEQTGGMTLKFPAFLNFQSIRQRVSGKEVTYDYNIAIVAPVQSEWGTQTRETQVFDLLLRPIYNEFMRQVKSCGYFEVGYETPSHEKYDVFTTGEVQTELIERYGDYIDAVEMHNLSLTVKKTICKAQLEQIQNEDALVTDGFENLLNTK